MLFFLVANSVRTSRSTNLLKWQKIKFGAHKNDKKCTHSWSFVTNDAHLLDLRNAFRKESWRQYVLHPSEAESMQGPPTKLNLQTNKSACSCRPNSDYKFIQTTVAVVQSNYNSKKTKIKPKYLWPPKTFCLKPYAKMQHNSKVSSIQNYVTIRHRGFTSRLLFLR